MRQKYTSIAEYFSKAMNFLKRLLSNSKFLKGDEVLAEILAENFKKCFYRIQKVKDNSFGQETNIGLYCTARHGNSCFTHHWSNLMKCEEICKMMMKATLDGDV